MPSSSPAWPNWRRSGGHEVIGGARRGALLAFLLGAAASSAQDQAGTGMTLVIDDARSTAHFAVHMRTRMRNEGRFPGVTGTLAGSPDQGWRVNVRVDGRSLRFEGPRWMERVTRSDSFLAVDRHPAIGFDSALFTDRALREGGPLGGDLTLRGVVRPVSFQLLPSTCAQPGRGCDIQVQGTISRHAFGMNAYRALVKDDVDFRISVRLLDPAVP